MEVALFFYISIKAVIQNVMDLNFFCMTIGYTFKNVTNCSTVRPRLTFFSDQKYSALTKKRTNRGSIYIV